MKPHMKYFLRNRCTWFDNSSFKLENPNNTDRIYLEVTDGKVKYNVGEDLD